MQLERLRSSPSGTDSELRGDTLGEGLGETLGDDPPVVATVTQRAEPSADSCRSEGPAMGDTGVRLPRGEAGAARLLRGLSDEELPPAAPGDQAGTAMDWRREEGVAGTPVTAMLARRRLGCEERRLPFRCSMVPLRTNIDMAWRGLASHCKTPSAETTARGRRGGGSGTHHSQALLIGRPSHAYWLSSMRLGQPLL